MKLRNWPGPPSQRRQRAEPRGSGCRRLRCYSSRREQSLAWSTGVLPGFFLPATPERSGTRAPCLWFPPLVTRGRHSTRNRDSSSDCVVTRHFSERGELAAFLSQQDTRRGEEVASCLRLNDKSCDGGLAEWHSEEDTSPAPTASNHDCGSS